MAEQLPIVAWRADDHGLPHVALTREGLGLLGQRYGYALTPHAPAQAAADERDELRATSERRSNAIQRLWKERDELRAEVEALRADRDRLDWLESQHKATVEIFSFNRWNAADAHYRRCWVIDRAEAADSLRAAIDTARASTDEGVGK